MKRKILLVMMLVFTASFVFTGCRPSDNSGATTDTSASDTETSAQTEPITLMLTHELAETHPSHIAAVEIFKPMVEEGTEGRVLIDVYPNSQLGTMSEVLEHIMQGQNEMIWCGDTVISVTVPEWSLVGLPFLFDNLSSAQNAMDGDFGDYLNDLLLEKDVVNLSWGDIGFRNITNSKLEIKSPADLKGLKIRTQQNDLHIEYFEDLGAVPTPMAFTELFTALQQKTVDGEENPIAIIYSNKLYEPQKYLTISEHVWSATGLFMSQAVFSSLSEADQQVILDAAKAATTQQREELTVQNEEYVDLIAENNIQVYRLTAEEKAQFKQIALDGVWKTAVEKYGQDIIDLAQKYNA